MPGWGDGKRNGSEERNWGSQCFSMPNEMRQPWDALLLRFHIRQESNRDRAAARAVTGGGYVGGWPGQLPVSVEWPTQKRRKQLQIGEKTASC
ncbi:hypothetical protein Vadar_007116 [Vaccinium darrowii]|uniref:Uncharacterized protein n=1 Tax=Vaccinium darrowii TaxID=229202 RepID=A0ACB7YTW6_9ERIC|nr:hypothetical protein Vadar_007116 [Vaccinium darrowii]